jgi:clan AA aspartic protease (TIGR02281 family)
MEDDLDKPVLPPDPQDRIFRPEPAGRPAPDAEALSFTVRWARRLPARWARNGAIFGALTIFARYGDSYIHQRPSVLAYFLGVMLTTAVVFAFIAFLLGLFARLSLSPIDTRHLTDCVSTIPLKWTVGALVVGFLIILSDVIFQWRAAVRGSETSVSIAYDVGYVAGTALVSTAIGLITGFISWRGLKRAIADDTVGFVPNMPTATIEGGVETGMIQSGNNVAAPDPKDRIRTFRPEMRRGFTWQRTSLVLALVAALAVIGGVSAFLNRAPPSIVSYEAFARLGPEAKVSAQRLIDEPCNRTLASTLVDDLLKKAEYAAIIGFAEKTGAKCGLDDELLESLYAAHEQSSDFIDAEHDAGELIKRDPADRSVYAWRAEAREALGNFEGAYSDFKISLSLYIDPSNVDVSVYYDVARLAAQAGHYCDAVLTLRDYVAFNPEQRRTQQIATLMRDWQQKGACPPLNGTGTAFLRFDAHAAAIIVPVSVNGVSARMILDTGASRTLLSKQLAASAGIEQSDVQGAVVDTANGRTWVSGGRANFISLGNARLSGVPVFIQPSTSSAFGEGADGLLGLSFLGNFRVRINAGALEIGPVE